MNTKFAALAATVAVASILTGSAFADNTQTQSTTGSFADNTSEYSNNDYQSWNTTDVANDKSVDSHNDASINNSFNTDIPISDSFNDNSQNYTDSHDNNSVNQTATGQVNLNYSDAGAINAADNGSTIFDGDVAALSLGDSTDLSSGGGNINTGVITDSVQGDYSAQFSNTGVGFNNSAVGSSTIGSSQTSNANLINP